ncbi:MAG: LptF/LptG family permease [Bdellovibrionota bacterium]
MQRLDKYFFFNLVKSTLGGVFLTLLLLLSLQVIRLGPIVVRTGVDFSILNKMLQGLSLSFTPIIIPIAFLFSSLSLFGRLSSDRELVALQGMGYSPWRLMRPCFLAGFALSLLTLFCALYIGPYGNRLFEKGIDEAFSKKGASILRAGTFNEEFLGRVIYVGEESKEGAFKKIFLYDKATFKEEMIISASEAQWNPPNKDKWAQLQLINGVIISKNTPEGMIRRIRFDEYRENADFRYAEGKSRDSMESQDLAGLLNKRANPPEKMEAVRWLWVEFARRFWVSISFFFFVPFCFIISLRNQRTAQSRVVLTGVLLAVFYWGLYFSIVSWSAKTSSMWVHNEALIWFFISIPNLVVGAVALKLIQRKFGRVFIT